MEIKAIDTHLLARELAGAMPPLAPREQRVAISLYRLLAEGRPSRPSDWLSAPDSTSMSSGDCWRAGRASTSTRRALSASGALLSIGCRTASTLTAGELRAWCAWDTLFLPELIGRSASVASSCPTTGETVSLQVIPGTGVHDVSPAGAVLSFLRREQPFDAETITSFCHFVHFFASKAAALKWTANRRNTFVLSIEEGFEIGRIANKAKFGAALAATRDHLGAE